MSASLEKHMLSRFNFEAKTVDEALFYYRNRSIQMLHRDLSWDGNYKDLGWGISVKINYRNELYDSVYVFEKNKGHFSKWLKEGSRNYLSMTDCHDMAAFLSKHSIPHKLIRPDNNECYYSIKCQYGDTRAKRSNEFYMNHIDEGIYILQKMDVRQKIIDAYCLHPIFQNDTDLSSAFVSSQHITLPQEEVFLAMEYRNIANAYLPHREISSISEIKLSPLEEVNQMLIADKIQNRKDFEKYHLNVHPNSAGLVKYFSNWFERLSITEEFYQEVVSEIESKTGNNVIGYNF